MNSQLQTILKLVASLFEVVTFLGISLTTTLNPVVLAQTAEDQPTGINQVLNLEVNFERSSTGARIQWIPETEVIAVGATELDCLDLQSICETG